MMHRWEAAARGLASVTIVLDENWRVVRAHIRSSHGSKLASQLLDDSSGWFNLNDLKMTRNVSWEPEELALCEARLDPDGRIRQISRNTKAAEHFDEFEKKREGRPVGRSGPDCLAGPVRTAPPTCLPPRDGLR